MASTPVAQRASAIQAVSAGSRHARRRARPTTVTPAARIHGNAPKEAAAANSSAESGTSSSGNARMRATFSTWLSTTVYQRNDDSRAAATYHPAPSASISTAPPTDSHARTGRSRPASHSAPATAPTGPINPNGSFANAATPRAPHPTSAQRDATGCPPLGEDRTSDSHGCPPLGECGGPFWAPALERAAAVNGRPHIPSNSPANPHEIAATNSVSGLT